MKKFLLASAALVGMATPAMAADTLTGATITGPSGTVWNTTVDGFYTLFLQSPGLGNFLNPNDESINLAVGSAGARALLAGEGWVAGGTADSDPVYNLLLNFASGNTLNGTYTPLTNVFTSGSSFNYLGDTFTLSEFSFRRNLGDSVSPFTAVPGGDGNDYNGNFRINVATAAVPEPATWAMMMLGFGAVAGALRSRRSKQTLRIRYI